MKPDTEIGLSQLDGFMSFETHVGKFVGSILTAAGQTTHGKMLAQERSIPGILILFRLSLIEKRKYSVDPGGIAIFGAVY